MQRVKTATAVTSRPAYTETGAPGYFTSGDAVAAIPATVPGAQWFNQVQEELLNAIKAGGLTPDATKDDQLAQAIAALIAAQAVTIGEASETVAGIIKLATQAMVDAGADGKAAVTPATLAVRLAALVTGLPVPAQIAGYRNLSLSASGLDALVSMSADEIVVADSSHQYKTLRGLSLSAATGAAGAGGLDTGTIASGTWYAVWLAYNPTTSAAALLLSLSATAPALPSGYTHSVRVGWVRTDNTASKCPLAFTQHGECVRYKTTPSSNLTVLPLMASGLAGDPAVPTWVAVPVAAFVPPTATSITISGAFNTTAASRAGVVAPNPTYSYFTSTINPPPVGYGTCDRGGYASVQADIQLESNNIYWASSHTLQSNLACVGWRDNI